MVRSKDLFDRSIIQDHNSEGYDSVDSEDFDPGFGCVPVYIERQIPPPPPVPDNRAELEKENDWFSSITETEKDRRNDEYLKQFGL